MPSIAGMIGAATCGLAGIFIAPQYTFVMTILGGLVGYAGMRKGIAEDIDPMAEEDADAIAEEWRQNRKPGEKSLDVSSSIGSGGLLFDLPLTRTYRYELETEEVKE